MIDSKAALLYGINVLKATSTSAQIDSETLLGFVLNTSKTSLYTHPERILNEHEIQRFKALIAQREQGFPIAYLIGIKEFWSLPLHVNENTLIPRPETELLVELTLSLLKEKPYAKILDLGTGSGAIALALASERPNWCIHAYDISDKALAVAKQNASSLQLTQVVFGQSSWFDAIPLCQYDAIVSNPPYIANDDEHLQQGDLRFEPSTALSSGKQGLDAITEIITQAKPYLTKDAFVLIEHGYDQKLALYNCFTNAGYFKIQHWKDWNGLDRVTAGYTRDHIFGVNRRNHQEGAAF